MRHKAGFLILLILILFLVPAKSVRASDFYYPYDDDGQLVVVLDPGHGGTNLGADYNGFLEKEMNMKVAKALALELKKYEGITVYLTHDDLENDMSLKERAQFAQSVNADILLCLHFNMSRDNILYGSEVWISGFGDENRIGYGFGKIQLQEMQELGLFIRGIKTRINEEGTDYYGILRNCEELSIPAVLIEHCHIDHEEDVPFCDSEEDLEILAKRDATAVAKFFCLRSEELGVDYRSNESAYLIPQAGSFAKMDTTAPDICLIEKKETNPSDRTVTIQVTACDYDTPIQYYAYSLDGGKTYSPYIVWPDTDLIESKSKDITELSIQIPEEIDSPQIRIKAVNQYDLFSESNILSDFLELKNLAVKEPQESIEDVLPVDGDNITVSTEDTESTGFQAPVREEKAKTDYSGFLKICLVLCIFIFIIVCTINIVLLCSKSHRSKKKK